MLIFFLGLNSGISKYKKINNKLLTLLIILIFFLLSSCSSDDYKKLRGTWTNGSIYLIIPDNSTLQISTNNDSIPEFSGSYSINGSDMFVTFSSGQITDSCLGEGKYEYKINAIALNLDFIRDDCPFRKEQFAKTFKKVK
ncbi:MAG: hypothetical protein JSS63_14710 [Bacteroidetes bacterium]|nr:hypothetical protein [Bacteroidota bacterium]